MRIRKKFLLLVLLLSASFVAIFGLSLRTYRTLSDMKGAIDSGVRLIAQSRRAYGLMKDVVFDLFSPRVYSSLQGIVLAPRSFATQSEWKAAADEFKVSYTAFMAEPGLRSLLADEELREAYTVAGPMSERAFSEVESLAALFDRIRERYPEEQELYARIQSSKDESAFALFDRVRSASFYLSNIFESYLNRFVSGLERQALAMERRVVVSYALAAMLVISLAAIGVVGMTRSLLSNLRLVDQAIERLASGDFSSRVYPEGHDEIGLLAERVNLFAALLKGNVDSLAALLADVNLAVLDAPDLDRIIAIVTDSLLRDGTAECAAVFLAEGGGRTAWSGFPPFPAPPPTTPEQAAAAPDPAGDRGAAWSFGGAAGDGRLVARCAAADEPVIVRDAAEEAFPLSGHGLDPSLRSIILMPLNVRRRVSGVCVFGRRDRPFTDLEISQLTSFADYAALVVENAVANAALAARRDAEFMALQSQIQPHFFYNILNGFVALNRMGERKRLEISLHALKDMLRYTIEHERWATVAEEFAFVERYSALQKLRFEERLDVSIDLPPAVAGVRVPKLILQPLVENAVIHGLEPVARPVRVGVSAREDGADIVLRVEDDGAGCEPYAPGTREGVGIGNVRERLALLFREAGLSLSGAPGEGFAAEIRLRLAELPPS